MKTTFQLLTDTGKILLANVEKGDLTVTLPGSDIVDARAYIDTEEWVIDFEHDGKNIRVAGLMYSQLQAVQQVYMIGACYLVPAIVKAKELVEESFELGIRMTVNRKETPSDLSSIAHHYRGQKFHVYDVDRGTGKDCYEVGKNGKSITISQALASISTAGMDFQPIYHLVEDQTDDDNVLSGFGFEPADFYIMPITIKTNIITDFGRQA